MAILGSPVGRDCAGSVQFCPVDELDELLARGGDIEWQSDKEINDPRQEPEVKEVDLARPGQTATTGGSRCQGAQAKTAVVYADGKYGIPKGTEPSTHIIKPTINDVELPDQALNEHVCLQTALNLGLSAVRVRGQVLRGGAVHRHPAIRQNDWR